jgi:GTP-binding protein
MISKYSNLPKVAIIGRPNVGKSTLFNILTESRKAVVKNQPGVTRDIMVDTTDVWGKPFEIIDTGGLTEAADTFSQLIKESVKEFLSDVDLLIVVMDGRAGLLPEDRDVIKIAKSVGKEMLIVINKVDKLIEDESAKIEFYEFGETLVSTSFEGRRGLSELLEWLHQHLPDTNSEIFDGPSVAIVGKPNVGKSSLVNAFLGDERMLVSPIAGTTIDSVDTPFIYKERKYKLIDTAGLRRHSKREDDVEIISAFKSQESIRRSNIVFLVVDGTIGPTDQDAKILAAILESHKGVILVANKSDLGFNQTENYRQWFKEKVEKEFHFFPDIPIVFTSAKTGQGLDELLDTLEMVSSRLDIRIPTRELNDFFFETIRKAPAPVWGTTNVKFYYLTQTYQIPPAFIAFANHPEGVTPGYRRFLVKHMKAKWDLLGIPVRIFIMKSRTGSSSSNRGEANA